MRTLGIAISFLAAASMAAESPVFEAVSVKPHRTDDNQRSLPQFLPGGRFVCRGMPLPFLINAAYDVGFQSARLSGLPDWVRSPDAFYDIEATAAGVLPAGLWGPARREKERQMLQALLADRFHLTVHRESRELPVYAVVVGKHGPKLDKSKIAEEDCREGAPTGAACHTIMGGMGRGLHGEAVTVADVVAYLENWTDRPLVNRTGIQGLYNVQTAGWTPMRPGAPPAAGAKGEDGRDLADVPTLYTVLDGLGLKLEAGKAAVDVFVVDRVERPTAN